MIELEIAHKTNPNAILLHSGILFDVFKPNPKDISIENIGHALSNLCRYAGHCPEFYSVAQHSYLCSLRGRTPEECLVLLLHDSSEGLGLLDLATPIKHNLEEYMKIEDNLMRVVFEHFKLSYPFSDYIKKVDRQLLELEYATFFLNKKDKESIVCWSSKKAKKKFLARFNELQEKLHKEQKTTIAN